MGSRYFVERTGSAATPQLISFDVNKNLEEATPYLSLPAVLPGEVAPFIIGVCRHITRCTAAALGVPRDRLFTHSGGWKDGELLYGAAVNRFSCPGWSFYRYAGDPRRDVGVRQALRQSDAPAWAASEWLYQGPREVGPWRRALENTLADRRCRFLCIFNWEGIRDSDAVLEAIRQVIAASADRNRPQD
jgi:hypothetical protein